MKICFVSLVVCAFYTFGCAAHAQFQELAHMVPGDANVLVLINEEKLLESDLAKRRNWAEKYENAFAAGLTFIPPGVNDYLLAGSVDFEIGHQNWEIALIKQSDGVMSPAVAAKQFGGKVETISGFKSVVLPGDTYVVKFTDSIAGSISPANRQFVSRWIRRAKSSNSDQISDYLQKAAHYANDFKTDIIIAFDLNDALAESTIENELLTADADERLAIKTLFDSLQGATLGINITDKIRAKLLIDFDTDATAFKSRGKKIVLDVLGKYGMMLDDLTAWKPKANGNRFELAGELSESSLRRLLLLIQPTGLAAGQYASYSTTELTAEEASVRYFRSLMSLHDDFKSHENETVRLHTSWLRKYIDKIDALSVVNVDLKLVEFGERMSSRYRDIFEQVALEKRDEKVALSNQLGYGSGRHSYTNSRYSRYGYGSYYSSRYNRGQRKATKDRTQARSSFDIRQLFDEIEQEINTVRHAMSQKYSVDF